MAIERVRYESHFDSSVNADRSIITLLKGSSADFSCGLVRAVRVEKEATLGNHWRDYDELLGLIGYAKVTLMDIDSGEKKEYQMITGSRLFIPARVALRIDASAGSVILSCAPEVDREKQTHSYVIN